MILDDRIAAAFQEGVSSKDLGALISDTEAAASESDGAAERARTRALDPLLPGEQAAEARRQSEDAAFRRERLLAAVTKLRDRLAEVSAMEEDQRRMLAYEAARADRDQLARELAEVYPLVTRQLADLLTRLCENDRQIEFINAHAQPTRAGRLLSAELVARGLEGFVQNSVMTPRITEKLRLPAFVPDQHAPYTWPRGV